MTYYKYMKIGGVIQKVVFLYEILLLKSSQKIERK